MYKISVWGLVCSGISHILCRLCDLLHIFDIYFVINKNYRMEFTPELLISNPLHTGNQY